MVSAETFCASERYAFSHLHSHLHLASRFLPFWMPQNHPFTISHPLGAQTAEQVLWDTSPTAVTIHRAWVVDWDVRVQCLHRVGAARGTNTWAGTHPCHSGADSQRQWDTLDELLLSVVVNLGCELGSFKNVLWCWKVCLWLSSS